MGRLSGLGPRPFVTIPEALVLPLYDDEIRGVDDLRQAAKELFA